MNKALALRLNALTRDFYLQNASSFSMTRQAPWPGWGRCLEIAETEDLVSLHQKQGKLQEAILANDETMLADNTVLHVLDLACGNLRFAHYLAEELGPRPVEYVGVDGTPALVEQRELPASWSLRYQTLDLVESVLAGGLDRDLSDCCAAPRDLCVAFAFLHHVPTAQARDALLRVLVQQLRPGGLCCVSLWRFMSDERLARKAEATTGEALQALGLAPTDLDAGDYLFGWQDTQGSWRYCHDFSSEEEVDKLAASVSDLAEIVSRFRADGRSGSLNSYLVLRRF